MAEDVPMQAGYASLLGARKLELKFITNQLAQCKHGSRAYQKMPRHMQRRQVSSNPKRLPRSIRDKNRKEVRDVIKTKKRPSRKYRRRPSNLLQEYAHRQIGNAWLETHIWHAKRFHMIKLWNYVLPQSPTACGHRSTMRAVRETCLVQDTSYETCLQLEGNRGELLDGLSRLVTNEDLQIISQDTLLQPEDWHEVMLHHPDKFPFKAIGSVRLYWHPCEKNVETNVLWSFVHPSILDEVINVMMSVFELLKVIKKEPLDEVKVEDQQGSDSEVSQSCSPQSSIVNSLPLYESTTGIRLYNLKGSINKFTLFGPKAVTILHNLLEPTNIQLTSSSELETVDKEKDSHWWMNYFEKEDHFAANQYQVSSWNRANISLPDRKTVFGLVVRDVRITLPAKKISFANPMGLLDDETTAKMYDYSGKAVYPILDRTICQKVSSGMASNDAVNKYRSSQLVPGSKLPLTLDESRVPILIMFNPGLKNNPSWEMIMPAEWARVHWVALQFQGAVAGGLKQEKSLFEELLIRNKPYLLPDSSSGQTYALMQSNEIENEYWKRPPKIRHNFIRLGTQHPFHAPWLRLVNSWCETCADYYVLRDEAMLNALAVHNSRMEAEIVMETKKLKLNSGKSLGLSRIKLSLPTIDGNSLIEVRLIMLGKGTLEPLATISIPTPEDLASLQQNIPSSTWSKLEEIKEPAHRDPNVAARRELKEGHIKLKLKFKRQRIRYRKKVKNYDMSETDAKDSAPQQNTDVIFDETHQDMKKLWLVDPTRDLQMCSRKIIGYVQVGDFSMLTGRSSGRGFVVAKPFIDMITKNEFKQLFVLTRNPNVLTYKWTRVEVICSS